MWRLLPVLLVCFSLSARADWQPISVQFPSMAVPGGQRAAVAYYPFCLWPGGQPIFIWYALHISQSW
jgi:hypothetical protein